MRVVINVCYGGFGLSDFALDLLGYEKVCWADSGRDFDRTDKRLIHLIRKYGSKKISGHCAKLKVVKISESYFHIDEYDGLESIIASNSPLVMYPKVFGPKL